jgi:hypothetical protein
MSLLAVQGGATGTGTVTLLAPVTNTNRTLTLPDETGTVVSTGSTAVVSQAMLATNVAGNGPAFSAYASTTQSLTNNSLTKLVLGAEEFDTANAFDSTTNYRFTPQVAGYYQINATATLQGGAGTGAYQVVLVKNGSSVYKRTSYFGTVDLTVAAVNIFYLNGSTDYVETYVYQNSGVTKTIYGAADTGYTYMTGCLVRAA